MLKGQCVIFRTLFIRMMHVRQDVFLDEQPTGDYFFFVFASRSNKFFPYFCIGNVHLTSQIFFSEQLLGGCPIFCVEASCLYLSHCVCVCVWLRLWIKACSRRTYISRGITFSFERGFQSTHTFKAMLEVHKSLNPCVALFWIQILIFMINKSHIHYSTFYTYPMFGG